MRKRDGCNGGTSLCGAPKRVSATRANDWIVVLENYSGSDPERPRELPPRLEPTSPWFDKPSSHLKTDNGHYTRKLEREARRKARENSMAGAKRAEEVKEPREPEGHNFPGEPYLEERIAAMLAEDFPRVTGILGEPDYLKK